MSKSNHPPPTMDEADSPFPKRRFRSTSPTSSGFTSVNVSSPSLSASSRASTDWSALSPGVHPLPEMPELPDIPRDDHPQSPSVATDSSASQNGPRGFQNLAIDSDGQEGSKDELQGTTHPLAHIQRLQAQLANVSDYLALLASANGESPTSKRQPLSSSLTFMPHALRGQKRVPNLPMLPVAVASARETELERENKQLKRAIQIQMEITARKRREAEQAQTFEPPPVVSPHGIDPEAISELANDLICGLKTINDVAAALLDLVERAGSTIVEKERERLHPLVRLNNAEGVLDITLDRVTALEKDTKSLKKSASWDVYRHIESSCRGD